MISNRGCGATLNVIGWRPSMSTLMRHLANNSPKASLLLKIDMGHILVEIDLAYRESIMN